jgi:F-type H+-transporting ATPase subunit b
MEGIAATLGLDVRGMIIHAINFIVLLVLLRLVLYKPVVTMLDERTRRVRESMEQADLARRQAEQAEADRQALLAETRREAEAIRARADEQAKRILADAGTRAQEEGSRILAQAKAQSDQERQQMLAEVRSQIADLVVGAVDRVTRGALDSGTQRTLVQQFLTPEPTPTSGNGSARPSR